MKKIFISLCLITFISVNSGLCAENKPYPKPSKKITNEIVKKLRILQPGTCIAFGRAFKIPMIVKMKLPNPVPESSNCDIISTWKA